MVSPSAHWSPDGRSILYTANSNNVTNLWSQPLDGGQPTQVTEFKDSLMTGFAWSRNGKDVGQHAWRVVQGRSVDFGI